jgi:site-specific recombinase XerD
MGELVDPLAAVQEFLAAEKSAATRRAYNADFAAFSEWCAQSGGADCSDAAAAGLRAAPLTVAKYLSWLAKAGKKASTLQRAIAAIAAAHKAAGYESPTDSEGVRAVMRGIRRTIGNKALRKAPATAAAIATMLETLPNNLMGQRDRALLLIGFAAALRRSELVALNVDDIERVAGGALLHIRRSKTDQEGKGQVVPLPAGRKLKPLAALDAWLTSAKIVDGAIFREVDRHGRVGVGALSDRTVARIVKRTAKAAGLDEKLFSGHSLRAGFVTSALADGKDPFKVMKITRHVDPKTLAAYDRRETELEDSAGSGFL